MIFEPHQANRPENKQCTYQMECRRAMLLHASHAAQLGSRVRLVIHHNHQWQRLLKDEDNKDHPAKQSRAVERTWNARRMLAFNRLDGIEVVPSRFEIIVSQI